VKSELGERRGQTGENLKKETTGRFLVRGGEARDRGRTNARKEKKKDVVTRPGENDVRGGKLKVLSEGRREENN